MIKAYSIADARAHLSEILDDVEAGVDVELTRRGQRVAIVMSPAKHARLVGRTGGFVAAYDRLRKRFDLTESGVDREWAGELRSAERGRDVDL